MNRIVIFLTVLAAVFIFSSCKKCYECIALDDSSAAVFQYVDICGTKKDFQAYEDRCEAEWGSFGYTCSCQEVE